MTETEVTETDTLSWLNRRGTEAEEMTDTEMTDTDTLLRYYHGIREDAEAEAEMTDTDYLL